MLIFLLGKKNSQDNWNNGPSPTCLSFPSHSRKIRGYEMINIQQQFMYICDQSIKTAKTVRVYSSFRITKIQVNFFRR